MTQDQRDEAMETTTLLFFECQDWFREEVLKDDAQPTVEDVLKMVEIVIRVAGMPKGSK